MTLEQQAAYINAQVAMFNAEIELLKAQSTVIVVDSKMAAPDALAAGGAVWFVENADQVRVHCVLDPAKLQAIFDNYKYVLSHNACLTMFHQYNG